MIGDKLVITDYHRAAAARAMAAIEQRLTAGSRTVSVCVAGESGSGKTETAQCLAEALERSGRTCILLSQDDYFRLPPKSNHNARLKDIARVGTAEVHLDLLGEHVAALAAGIEAPLTKPLVYFEEDRIGSETIMPGRPDVVVAEGTYSTLLPDIDIRVFINRNYRETKRARLARAREPDIGFLERVLQIEHEIISQHKVNADVVIEPPAAE